MKIRAARHQVSSSDKNSIFSMNPRSGAIKENKHFNIALYFRSYNPYQGEFFINFWSNHQPAQDVRGQTLTVDWLAILDNDIAICIDFEFHEIAFRASALVNGLLAVHCVASACGIKKAAWLRAAYKFDSLILFFRAKGGIRYYGPAIIRGITLALAGPA